MRSAATAGVATAALILAACSTDVEPPSEKPAARSSADVAGSPSPTHGHDAGRPAPRRVPLRAGERIVDVRMPSPYTPAAAKGTDDYRCFLLDPKVGSDSFVTGVDVAPGDEDVVHHVILFRVPPDQVAAAERTDAQTPGQGWTCFGGSGLDTMGGSLDNAPWLGAWAPGGGERVLDGGIGIPLEAGSRIVMQVHYNLLAGTDPDRSSARLRIADGSRRHLRALETMLLPAPVELPCRPAASGPLCDREHAVLDVMDRFGMRSGQMVAGLQFLCGDGDGPRPGTTQSCTRTVEAPATVRAVAGHMHLLGRKIRIELDPGTPRARTLLDIPVWDFDDQGTRALDHPARIRPGDRLKVTCTHDQGLRDKLPAFDGRPERYVVWGEGTTDEMCLGIVLVTRP